MAEVPLHDEGPNELPVLSAEPVVDVPAGLLPVFLGQLVVEVSDLP
jgi:hypothetical protein